LLRRISLSLLCLALLAGLGWNGVTLQPERARRSSAPAAVAAKRAERQPGALERARDPRAARKLLQLQLLMAVAAPRAARSF